MNAESNQAWFCFEGVASLEGGYTANEAVSNEKRNFTTELEKKNFSIFTTALIHGKAVGIAK